MKGGNSRWWIGASLVAALAGVLVWSSSQAEDKPAEDAAVARTRKQVKMLDDLYKTVIVMITENYVTEKSDLAAGAAFQHVFAAMKKAGHHEVRLLDATGEPYEDKNVAKDEFEKAAIAALKAGKPGFEQIVGEGRQALPAGSHADSGRDEEMHDVPRELRNSQAGRTDRGAGIYGADRVVRAREAGASRKCGPRETLGPSRDV